MYFVAITAMFTTIVYYVHIYTSKHLYDDYHKLVDHG